MRLALQGSALVVGVALALSAARTAHAQVQATLPIAPAAIAESIKVVEALGAHVKAKPNAAAAWYRRGLIALALSNLALRGQAPELNEPKFYRIAYESIPRALELDPTNPQFLFAAARMEMASGGMFGRESIHRYFEAAFAHARTRADSLEFAAIALQIGSNALETYEKFEDRALEAFAESPNGQIDLDTMRTTNVGFAPTGIPRSAGPTSVTAASGRDYYAQLPQLLWAARDSVIHTMSNLPYEVAGERQLLQAERWLSQAYAANAADDRAFQGLAKVLAARKRWNELLAVGQRRLVVSPDDPWGWMAIGLAQQRSNATGDARKSFAKAFALFSPTERDRLDRLDRVLSRGDSVLFRRGDSTAQAQTQQSSWLLSDPLWSTSEEDPRVEFHARVAFAELRWSAYERRGADTPRGDIYVRYGPPESIIGIFWLYDSGLMFALSKGVMSYNLDPEITRNIKEWQPSRWDNIAKTRIDSMPIQAARFRAGPDSVELFIAALAPLEAMRTVAGVNTPARADFWLYSWTSPDARRDSVALRNNPELRWAYRMPAGNYYYRLESTVPGALIAGRAAASIVLGPDTSTGFTTRGFGVSDLLLARTADGGTGISRWRDIATVPLMGPVAHGSELALVWEIYELGRTGNDAQYEVTVSIDRERSRGGRIAAIIGSRLSALVGRDETDDGVAARFERTMPHAAVFADYVTIAIGETPPGDYKVTLQIRDRVTGQVTSRTTRIVVRE